MIANVQISGIGPIEQHRFDLDASGTVRFVGASETGKSTLLEAVCFLLWGTDSRGGAFPVELIRPGAKRAEVVGTTAKGAAIGRSITPGRTIRRWIEETEYANEEDFRAALKAVARVEEIEGKAVPVGRLVLAPLSWVPLAQTSGGRPLRDLVSKLGGSLRDVVKQIFPDLRDEDPIGIKNASPLRAEAKKARDQAEGAMSQARASLAALGAPPDPIDATEAGKVVDLAARFVEVDRYEQNKTRLGEEPPKVAAKALAEAKKAYEQAQRDYLKPRDAAKAAVEALGKAKASVAEAVRALEAFDATPAGACPTCGVEWAGRADHRHGLVELHRMMVDQAAEAQKANVAAEEARIAAEKVGIDAKGKLDALTKAQDARTAWERSRDALGEAPVVRENRPTPEAVAAAKKVVDDAKAAEGARTQHARLYAAAKEQVARAEARHAETVKLAEHYERLVEAVREAPAKLFAAGVSKLGELGPVKLVADEEGVVVLIDGRPWWLASRGRQISADVWLRAGLRRGFGMGWFPMIVDDVQSWTGTWPMVSPAVFLETVPGKALERAA